MRRWIALRCGTWFETAWLRDEGEDVLSLGLRAVPEVRPTSVLDVGCGAGEFTSLISAPEVRAVDISATAVESARARGLEATHFSAGPAA